MTSWTLTKLSDFSFLAEDLTSTTQYGQIAIISAEYIHGNNRWHVLSRRWLLSANAGLSIGAWPAYLWLCRDIELVGWVEGQYWSGWRLWWVLSRLWAYPMKFIGWMIGSVRQWNSLRRQLAQQRTWSISWIFSNERKENLRSRGGENLTPRGFIRQRERQGKDNRKQYNNDKSDGQSMYKIQD